MEDGNGTDVENVKEFGGVKSSGFGIEMDEMDSARTPDEVISSEGDGPDNSDSTSSLSAISGATTAETSACNATIKAMQPSSIVPRKSDLRARRFVTFNVCGIKNVLNFRPWNEKKTFENMFEIFDGDIVCFQETKIQPRDVTAGMALVEGYNAFFTFPARKKGYSGVAIYVKKDIPVYKAEHGLTGWLQSQDYRADESEAQRSERSEQRVWAEPSRRRQMPMGDLIAYRELADEKCIGGYPENIDEKTGLDIDSEGRSIVLDLGFCVVIGLYCPADSMGDKTDFRNGFYETLDLRIRNLVGKGRRVVLMGDLNVSRDIVDSAPGRKEWIKEGILRAGSGNGDQSVNEFLKNNAEAAKLWRNASNVRKIFHKWLDCDDIGFIDTSRKIHPDRWGMYTCWNQVIDARPGNFGTRLDYVLISKGVECIGGDILPGLYGSDHCPVYADILWENDIEMEGSAADDSQSIPLPRMCASYQFAGKQGNIRALFSSYTGGSAASTVGRPAVYAPRPTFSAYAEQPSSKLSGTTIIPVRTTAPTVSSSSSLKRNAPSSLIKRSSKQQKSSTKSQSSILSFWKKSEPTDAANSANSIIATATTPITTALATATATDTPTATTSTTVSATLPPFIPEQPPNQASINNNSNEWKKLFSPATPPLCRGHQEPCKLLISKRNGINKGRAFWICSR